MISNYSALHLTPEQIDSELLPAIQKWDAELGERGTDRHLWFLFGSVVNRSVVTVDTESIDPRLQALGIRGPSRNFGVGSDIDVGLIVTDGHDEISLGTDNPQSIFLTAAVANHPLELTRFEESWVARRGTDVATLQTGKHPLSIYGPIVPIQLSK